VKEPQELRAALTDVDHDSPDPRSALHVEQRVQPSDVHEGRLRQIDRQARARGVDAQELVEAGGQHRSREPVELPTDVQHHPAGIQPLQTQAESVGLPGTGHRIVIPSRPKRDQCDAEWAVRGSAGLLRRTRARFSFGIRDCGSIISCTLPAARVAPVSLIGHHLL
jgi:hypothetical protein